MEQDKYLLSKDIINSSEAVAFITVNGVNKRLFYVKKINSDIEFTKKEYNVMGKRGTQNKIVKTKITGTMTIYGVTSEYKKMASDYMKNGIEPRFELTTVNNDPAATIGKETVVLHDCLPDKVNLMNVDFDSEDKTEEIGFTADGFDLLDEFGVPENLAE